MSNFLGTPRILAGLPQPPPPDPFAYHFFVSYTTREQEVKEILPTIDQFVDELKAAGLRAAPVFFDRFTIGRWHSSDAELEGYLREAVRSSLCMLAFVSPGYISSEWCTLEWRTMERERPGWGYTYTFPVVWKDLGDIGWDEARRGLNLDRLPKHIRVLYPTYMHMFIPPKIELMSARYSSYFPVETFDDQLGWERALKEAYSFFVDRTNLATGRRRESDY